MYIVYKLTNTRNGKKYIGCSKNFEDRMSDHLKVAYCSSHPGYNYPLYRAIRKNGWHCFSNEILATCNNRSEMFLTETQFIITQNTHTRFGKGYNQTYGGEGSLGGIYSEERLRNMSKCQLGKKKSPETLKRLHESMLVYGEKIAKEWEITYPDGHTSVIKNLCRFCKENGLDQGNMMKVAKGISSHCKGYLCKRK